MDSLPQFDPNPRGVNGFLRVGQSSQAKCLVGKKTENFKCFWVDSGFFDGQVWWDPWGSWVLDGFFNKKKVNGWTWDKENAPPHQRTQWFYGTDQSKLCHLENSGNDKWKKWDGRTRRKLDIHAWVHPENFTSMQNLASIDERITIQKKR